MENNQQSSIEQQILHCVDKNFKVPKDFIIPFEGTVIVKKLEQAEITTDSGLIIGGVKARNIVTPNIGIVYAVGPRVPEYIKAGLKVYFNQNVDLEFWISGGFYHMMFHHDVYGAIPENSLVTMDTKQDKEIIREDALIREEGYQDRKKQHDSNLEDKLAELAKKYKA